MKMTVSVFLRTRTFEVVSASLALKKQEKRKKKKNKKTKQNKKIKVLNKTLFVHPHYVYSKSKILKQNEGTPRNSKFCLHMTILSARYM